MITINQEVLKNFLLENDIYIIDKYFKNKRESINISNHIDIIINLQEILMRYHSIEKNSILSEIGKRVDRISVMAKKLDERFYQLNYYEKCVVALNNAGGGGNVPLRHFGAGTQLQGRD